MKNGESTANELLPEDVQLTGGSLLSDAKRIIDAARANALIHRDLPVNPSVNLPVELSTTAKKIYHLLKEDGKYTYDRLSEAVGVTRETVRGSIRSLVEANLIRRVGPDKTGHWEVVK